MKRTLQGWQIRVSSVEFACKSRHSSVVEQLIRNQQARGSTPRAGSSEIKGLADEANPICYSGYHSGTIF